MKTMFGHEQHERLAKRTHGGRKLWGLSLPDEPEAVRRPRLWNSEALE